MKVKKKHRLNDECTAGLSDIDKQIMDFTNDRLFILEFKNFITEIKENPNNIPSTVTLNEKEIRKWDDDTDNSETEDENKSIENVINLDINFANHWMVHSPSKLEHTNLINEFKDQFYRIFVNKKRFDKKYVIIIHDEFAVKYIPNIKKMSRDEKRSINIYFQNYVTIKDQILKCLEIHKQEILDTVFQNYEHAESLNKTI